MHEMTCLSTSAISVNCLPRQWASIPTLKLAVMIGVQESEVALPCSLARQMPSGTPDVGCTAIGHVLDVTAAFLESTMANPLLHGLD